MDIKFKCAVINVSVSAHYKEFQPYLSMIKDGEVTEQEMQAAADHICFAIEAEARSGKDFRVSYAEIKSVQAFYDYLGFGDSEGNATVNEICRRVWGKPACDYLGEW